MKSVFCLICLIRLASAEDFLDIHGEKTSVDFPLVVNSILNLNESAWIEGVVQIIALKTDFGDSIMFYEKDKNITKSIAGCLTSEKLLSVQMNLKDSSFLKSFTVNRNGDVMKSGNTTIYAEFEINSKVIEVRVVRLGVSKYSVKVPKY